MTTLQLNEHGVPQYPKGHTGRLLVTLAAIEQLKRPTVTTIAELTGLSKGKVDDYVQALCNELGVKISKTESVYSIDDWGVILKRAGVKTTLKVPLNGTTVEPNETD
ncbi:hypothetical protein [Pseudomonas sp. EMN2]|uniref:hypothetical protein n=1 Tax=Pseudomonas sp. EMN2 TaxID=2615212 RepID=UPI00129AC097|nr:hypothetical protein [Pseudomonas sp. EMN2]